MSSTNPIEQSPSWEKSREAMRRPIKKRKSSKNLKQIFERESLSMMEGCSMETSSGVFSSSQISAPPDPLRNISNTQFNPPDQKRLRKSHESDGELKLIDWGDEHRDPQRMMELDVSTLSMSAPEPEPKLCPPIAPVAPIMALPPDWDDSEARSPFDTSFDMASTSAAAVKRVKPGTELNKSITNQYPIDFSHLNAFLGSGSKRSSMGASSSGSGLMIAADAQKHSSLLPCDFRVGTRIRLVAEQPFPWLSGKHATMIGNHPVQIPDADFQEALGLNIQSNPSTCSSALVLLQCAAFYHQFPAIGPVQLFPRRSTTIRSSSSTLLKSANLQGIEPTFLATLGTQWAQSLLNLLHNWSSSCNRHHDSFYLCAPQFTALFVTKKSAKLEKKNSNKSPRKTMKILTTKSPKKAQQNQQNNNSPFRWATRPPTSGSSAGPSPLTKSPGKQRINMEEEEGPSCSDQYQQHFVVITPTTSGFRQILTSKGIDFSLPFKAAEFVDLSGEECPKDFLPSQGDESVGMDHDEWLRDIGISPRATLKLKRSASELDTSTATDTPETGSKKNDHLARKSSTPMDSSKSTVLLSGPKSADAFCRLLISQPALCSTKTGPQAGLPPTLISLHPFRHSALKEFSMTSQVLKKQGKLRYVLEMEHGPVMPGTIEMLVNFTSKMGCSGRVQLHVNGRTQCNGFNQALSGNKNSSDKVAGQQQQHGYAGDEPPVVNFVELDFGPIDDDRGGQRPRFSWF